MATPTFDTKTSVDGNLLELCPIAPGSIVSKPLIDTGPFKLILFAMDAGQELSEHRAPYVATVQMLSGHMRFGYAGKEVELKANDWVLMKPDESHDVTALEPSQFLLTLVKD